MQHKNDEQRSAKESNAMPQCVLITPETLNLLDFLSQRELPDIIKDLTRVFDIACFFSAMEINEQDKGSLYIQKTLIDLLTKMQNSNERTNDC